MCFDYLVLIQDALSNVYHLNQCLILIILYEFANFQLNVFRFLFFGVDHFEYLFFLVLFIQR